MKLIDKAKSKEMTRRMRYYSDDEVELSLAWLKGEITSTQAAYALGLSLKHNSNWVKAKMAAYLKDGLQRGKFEVKLLKL